MSVLDRMQTFALPLAREERAAHLQGFRGRTSLLDRLVEASPANGPGRFTLLLGGPGAGKSALAAALSQRLGAPYHFVRGHREPRRFVVALIEQCQAAAGRPAIADERAEHRRASSDDLKNALCEALSALVRERGRADLVIDALDELERPVDLLAFLPAVLPARSNIFLTGRPDLGLVATLRARYTPLEVLTLPPLSLDDLRGSNALSEGELQALIGQTGGLPLLLFPALVHAERIGHVKIEQVATSERDLFEGLLAEAMQRVGPAATPLLSVLAVIQEPLPCALLARVLDALAPPGPELPALRGAIQALSGMLEVSRDGHVRLWHTSFAQYIRAQLVGDRAAPSLHRAIARACESEPTSPFALRNAVLHLVEAGDVLGATGLAESAGRVTAQLRAGFTPEVLRDLERVGSRWLAPLRRQAPFLSAHPRALASALSFEGSEPPASTEPWVRTLWRSTPHGPLPLIALEGQLPEVLSLALSPDGKRLAIAAQDGHLREYDTASGERLCDRVVSKKRALAVAYAPQGRWLACGTDDGVTLFDIDPQAGTPRELAHDAPVWALAWLPDGTLATGSRQGELSLFDRAFERFWTARLPFPVSALAAGPRGSLIVGGARGGMLVLCWETALVSGAEPRRWRLEEGGDGAIWSIVAHGDRFAMARHDGALGVFELRPDEGPVKLAELVFADERLFAASFIGPDTLVCAGSAGRLHRVALTVEGLISNTAWAAHRGWVNSVASDGRCVWSAGTDGVVLAHQLSGTPLVADEVVHLPTALACCSGGEEVALGYADGAVEVRSALASEPTASARDVPVAVSALALSPRFLMLGGRDGTLLLYRRSVDPLTKRRRLGAPTMLEPHDAEVTAAWFLSGHGQLATASRDRTLRLYALVGARRVATVDTPATITDLDETEGALIASDRNGGATHFAIPDLSIVSTGTSRDRLTLVDGRYTTIVDREGRGLAVLPTRAQKPVRVHRLAGTTSEWLALAEGGVIQFALVLG